MILSLRNFTLLLCLCCSAVLFAQYRGSSNRPPWLTGKPSAWMAGELPNIQVPGNYLDIGKGAAKTREAARKEAIHAFVQNLITKASANISTTETRHETVQRQLTDGKMQERIDVNSQQDVTIDGKTVARYVLLDEYYEYANGRWHCAGLFLVAAEGMSLANVPPITYGVDHGAWRSLLLPGWAQLFQRRTAAGIGYMAVQAGLIGSTIYLNNLASYYRKRQNEAFNINVKQDYKKRFDQTNMMRNISAGVCAAWYVLNVIDAFTSQRGKLYYTTSYRSTQFSFAPTVVGLNTTPTLGLSCSLHF